MAYGATKNGLNAAFDDWTNALNAGDLKSFYAFFDARSEILDEDYPWRMNKEEFIDHIGFHAGATGNPALWEHFKWIPRDVEAKVWHKHTGQVSGFSTFRGKPVDAIILAFNLIIIMHHCLYAILVTVRSDFTASMSALARFKFRIKTLADHT